MEKIAGNTLRGHLEAMVLATLAHSEAHGFEIMQRLGTAGRGALDLKEGTLYPVLYRLEAAGLIVGKWESDTSSRRGPRRRVYRLAGKGRRDLKHKQVQWRQFIQIIGPIVEAPA